MVPVGPSQPASQTAGSIATAELSHAPSRWSDILSAKTPRKYRDDPAGKPQEIHRTTDWLAPPRRCAARRPPARAEAGALSLPRRWDDPQSPALAARCLARRRALAAAAGSRSGVRGCLREQWLGRQLARRYLRLRSLSFPHSRGARCRARHCEGPVWRQQGPHPQARRRRRRDPAGRHGASVFISQQDFHGGRAYPPTGIYDECGPTKQEHERGVRAVRKVARPRKDPLFGPKGPLLELWPKQR